MNLSELIQRVGEERTSVQFLTECMKRIEDCKKPMPHTAITFGTNQMRAGEAMGTPKMIAFVCWLPRDAAMAEIAADELRKSLPPKQPRMSTTHMVKTWPEFFEHRAEKPFEVRKADRDYRVGDILHQREWEPKGEEYTGREYKACITYILEGGQHGVAPGYCILGLK